MHSLLEDYLSELATHLHALPVVKRGEELREMRQHLLNAVIVNRELGQSEDEAAQKAIEQFGTPEALGQSVVRAWRRGEALRKRDFWSVAGCSLALAAILPPLFNESLIILRLYRLLHTLVSLPHLAGVIVTASYVIHMVAGVIGGLLFPKRAISGTALGAGLWYGCLAALVLFGVRWVYNVPLWVSEYAEFALLTVFGAWIGSRWQGRRARSSQGQTPSLLD